MTARNHYLIEIPPRCSGIYLILNLPKKTAYVGLAKDLAARTLDHFKAICCNRNDSTEEADYLDNRYILEEKEKNFLHIPIWRSEKPVGNQRLHDIESIFIRLVRDGVPLGEESGNSGFKLYNEMKKGYTPEDVIRTGSDKQDEIKDLDEYRELERVLLDSLNRSLNGLLPDRALSLDTLCAMEHDERDALWNDLIKGFADSRERGDNSSAALPERYILSKDSGNTYSADDSFATVWDKLSSFCISKEKLRALGIDWKTKSIFDPSLTIDRLTFISNYGSHNGEAPYDILLKKHRDMQTASDGCCYWALKKLNEEDTINAVRTRLGTPSDNTPLYILFKTTESDNSDRNHPRPNLESVKSEDQLKAEYDERLRDNDRDIKSHYYAANPEKGGVWKPIESCYPVTSPWGNNRDSEYKSVAFKISEFFVCNEYLEVNQEITSTKASAQAQANKFIHTDINIHPDHKEDGNINTGQCPVYKAECDLVGLKSRPDAYSVIDDTQILIAKVVYPYVVQIGYIPTFEVYLSGRVNGATEYRVLIETDRKPSTLKDKVKRAVCLYRDGDAYKAWVFVPENVSIENILNDENAALGEEIQKVGYEADFRLSYEQDGKVQMTFSEKQGEENFNYVFDKSYDPIREKSVLYLTHDDIASYYAYPVQNGSYISFRYREKKTGKRYKPPFVFE